jgi:hypothetical protein
MQLPGYFNTNTGADGNGFDGLFFGEGSSGRFPGRRGRIEGMVGVKGVRGCGKACIHWKRPFRVIVIAALGT